MTVSLRTSNTDRNKEVDISKRFTWKRELLAVFGISHFAEHIHSDLMINEIYSILRIQLVGHCRKTDVEM